MKEKYLHPTDQLLTFGDCHNSKWPNYLELGFTEKHIGNLIEMTLDDELHDGMSDSDQIWAPVHAWRTLGQLKAHTAAKDLLKLLPRIEKHHDEWVADEIPEVFKMLGPKTISVINHYLETNKEGQCANITATESLERIGNAYPEYRMKCVNILEDQLRNNQKFDSSYNGLLVSYLVDLNAIEALDAIAAAYEKEVVDLSIMGDFEEVEMALGLRTERSTPAPIFGFFRSDTADVVSHDPDFKTNPHGNKQIVRSTSKIGRNDLCYCGSGKKYKKCCL